ncbi:starvation-inducible DNA-binding protein [Halomicrobium zhouii]|uniref:Starvation-inducible DNA-binding protein n=1 Tax=Halomicrobium zhouii TaxID=767519 RepID=A0A1I6M1L3_9EURY|nr:DNA starvation/stationary phase protection protein Dps [Halomicrobium zhouii]SFS09606.1 starvation-inducible DNA-binding protein [Halomicrobium zhouii]
MSHQQPPTQSQQSEQPPNDQQPPQPQHAQQQVQMQSQGGQLQRQSQPRQADQRLFPTRNFLDERVRATSITALNQVLADITAVTMQTKTAHWNVRGPNFYQLHELFEDVADTLEAFTDDIAERATALGGQAHGTAPVVARESYVPQMPPTLSDEQALLEAIASSLARFDATLYEQINAVSEQGDLDTADLLNEVSRGVSKALWLVEAHLQGQGPVPGQAQRGMQ